MCRKTVGLNVTELNVSKNRGVECDGVECDSNVQK
jgi:hypothetical protein